jgi:hypothetical protein
MARTCQCTRAGCNRVWGSNGWYQAKPKRTRVLSQLIGDPSKHHLFEVFQKGLFSDFSILYAGKKFLVHRLILYGTTQYFQTMFTGQWKEGEETTFEVPEIKGISAAVFEIFLLFLYTQCILSKAVMTNLSALYELAEYFLAVELKEILLDELYVSLSCANIKKYLPFYKKYQDSNSQIKQIFKTFTTDYERELKKLKN